MHRREPCSSRCRQPPRVRLLPNTTQGVAAANQRSAFVHTLAATRLALPAPLEYSAVLVLLLVSALVQQGAPEPLADPLVIAAPSGGDGQQDGESRYAVRSLGLGTSTRIDTVSHPALCIVCGSPALKQCSGCKFTRCVVRLRRLTRQLTVLYLQVLLH